VRPQLEELEVRALLSAPSLAPIGPTPAATGPSAAVYSVGPTVNPTTTSPAAEESIAIDPNNFQNLLAAVIDFGSGRSVDGITGLSMTKFTVSSDNGTSWADGYLPIDTNPLSPTYGFLPTADGHFWDWNGDPVVAVDKLGNAYLSSIYSDKVTQGLEGSGGLYVAVQSLAALPTTGFPAAQVYPVQVNLGTPVPQHVDKDWIAVDDSSSPYAGNVYVSWTLTDSRNRQSIEVSRSTDQGRTWSPPVTVSPASQGVSVTGSQLAVGPDGTVYVAHVSTPSRAVHERGGPAQIFLAASADGGLTFSAPAAVTPVFNFTHFPAFYRENSNPALAVSPTNGNVYLAYTDQPSAAAGAQVEFIRSTDRGKTFSSPAPINDVSTGQHFLPALAVDGSGVVHASWFDTRNSRSPFNNVLDVYAALSTNDGASFSPNVRVTTTSIYTGAARFVGDYTGIAAAGGFAHPVWSSGSVGTGPETPGVGRVLTGSDNSRLQTATLSLPRNQPAAPEATAATIASPPSRGTTGPAEASAPFVVGGLFLRLNDLIQVLYLPREAILTKPGYLLSGGQPEQELLPVFAAPIVGLLATPALAPGLPQLLPLLQLRDAFAPGRPGGTFAPHTGRLGRVQPRELLLCVVAESGAAARGLGVRVTPGRWQPQQAQQLAGAGEQFRQGQAAPTGLVREARHPVGVGMSQSDPTVAGLLFLAYAGLGLMIQRWTHQPETPGHRIAGRTAFRPRRRNDYQEFSRGTRTDQGAVQSSTVTPDMRRKSRRFRLKRVEFVAKATLANGRSTVWRRGQRRRSSSKCV
jgi:hypothetical protein